MLAPLKRDSKLRQIVRSKGWIERGSIGTTIALFMGVALTVATITLGYKSMRTVKQGRYQLKRSVATSTNLAAIRIAQHLVDESFIAQTPDAAWCDPNCTVVETNPGALEENPHIDFINASGTTLAQLKVRVCNPQELTEPDLELLLLGNGGVITPNQECSAVESVITFQARDNSFVVAEARVIQDVGFPKGGGADDGGAGGAGDAGSPGGGYGGGSPGGSPGGSLAGEPGTVDGQGPDNNTAVSFPIRFRLRALMGGIGGAGGPGGVGGGIGGSPGGGSPGGASSSTGPSTTSTPSTSSTSTTGPTSTTVTSSSSSVSTVTATTVTTASFGGYGGSPGGGSPGGGSPSGGPGGSSTTGSPTSSTATSSLPLHRHRRALPLHHRRRGHRPTGDHQVVAAQVEGALVVVQAVHPRLLRRQLIRPLQARLRRRRAARLAAVVQVQLG